MKSHFFKKISTSLVVLMLLSAMLPVLAFAGASFKNVVYHSNGTVTGVVYSVYSMGNTVNVSVYGVTNSVYGVTDDVYLSDLSNSVASSVYERKYSVSDNVYYYEYDFVVNSVIGSTYNPIVLKAFDLQGAQWGVTDVVYRETSSSNPGTGTPGTGTPGTPGTDNGNPGGKDGVIEVGNEVAADALAKAFEGRTDVTIVVKGDEVAIPASALAEVAKKKDAKIVIENENGTYELPLSVIDFAGLAEELGVELGDLKITVTIKALADADAKPATDAIAALGGSAVAAVVDFSVTAEGNGKSVAIENFGNTYVSRSLNVNKDIDAKNVTGVLYNPETGEFSFIPATFADGIATLKSTSNSIYTVVEFNNSFADVTGDWSEQYVVPMANKLIVEGYEDGSFGPDRTITRAEFAALVVRALGLSNRTATSDFSDVNADAWYANDVAVAAEAGLIKGFEDGTFRPTAEITREQLSALVVRASAFAGKDLNVEASEQASILAKFRDASDIGWAQAEIAAAVKAGIVQGLKADLLGSDNTATRAEAATMLYRFLVNAEFINE